jgi:LPS-assembly protein
MLNSFKFIFFISIYFFSFLSSLNGSEQFNFDITEVEILENGNRFKGIKKGVVTTNDGIIINADTFDYNKSSNILKANGNVKIIDTIKNIIIYSDNIIYYKGEEKIITENNSKATYGDFIITADKFYYNKISNILNANTNVKIDDVKKNIIIYSEDITYKIDEEKVFTKNGSRAIDGGLIVTADKFYYNKISNILNAKDDAKINDTLKDIIVYSDDITYLKNEEKIFTKGNTNAIVESKYDFISSNVLLLRNENKLSSTSKTKIVSEKIKSYELDEFVYFFDDKLVKGVNVKVNSNINVKKGETDHLKFKDGFFNLDNKTHKAGETIIELRKDNFDNPENDPRIVGVSSQSTNNKTVIKKGVFTSCKKIDGKCPPWSIKADKITHDRVKKQLTYDHAFLRVYDVPVMYFPKFFHPDPSVKRQSGFLKPQLNNSDILGSSIYLPYYKVISQNKDLTFKPTIFDSNIYMIQNEYRQANEHSFFFADVGLTKGYKSSLEGSNRNSMSHIFSRFNKDLRWDNFTSSKLNVFGEKVSNDTYLKIFDNNLMETVYKPKNFNNLKSGIELELDHENYTFDSGITIYENLRTTKNSDRFQFVFPYYSYSTDLLTEKNIGGSISFDSTGSNVLGDTNSLTTSVNNSLSYNSYDNILNNGIKNNFNIYTNNGNEIGKKNPKVKNSPDINFGSIFEFRSSIPLIKKEKTFINTLEPKLSLRINPSDKMDDNTTASRRITADNIFNINRLALGDFESGKSLTAGLDYKRENIEDINRYFEIKLATVIRDVTQNKIPLDSTINRRGSNLFGSIDYGMTENLSLDYDFSLDNDFNTFEYSSFGATFDNEKLYTKLNFIEENGVIGDANSLETEIGYNFDEFNYFKFKTRRNRTISLTEYYDLIYEYKNDCLTAGFKYKKTYYQDRDLKPKEDLLFTITFFPLSTFEQEIDQQLYRN